MCVIAHIVYLYVQQPFTWEIWAINWDTVSKPTVAASGGFWTVGWKMGWWTPIPIWLTSLPCLTSIFVLVENMAWIPKKEALYCVICKVVTHSQMINWTINTIATCSHRQCSNHSELSWFYPISHKGKLHVQISNPNLATTKWRSSSHTKKKSTKWRL